MQGEIDAGLKFCEGCERFGYHDFCGTCGHRFVGAGIRRRDCPRCRWQVTTTFCSNCGQIVVTDLILRWERGDIDLEVEGARAQVQVDTFLKRHPKLLAFLRPESGSIPTSGMSPASLVDRINRGFGRAVARLTGR